MATEAVSKNLKLLIIEDEPEIAKAIVYILEPYVKQVFTAQNGKDGMRLFMKHKPDIVFTDIYLPEMNGVEITKKIKNLKNTTSVAMISSNQDKEIFKSAINAGADYYIEKPFQKETILEAINATSKKFLANLHTAKENRRLKLIFNSHNHLIAMTNGRYISNANKPFTDFFGMKNIRDIEAFLSAFISPTGALLKKEPKWIDVIINLPVKLLKLRSADGKYKKFFPKIDFLSHTQELYLLTLTDVTDFEQDIEENKKNTLLKPQPLKPEPLMTFQKISETINREIYRKHRYKSSFCIIKISFTIHEESAQVIDKKNIASVVERVTKASIRPTDIFEKISDGDFIVLATHTKTSGANILQERLKTNLLEDGRLKIHDIDFKLSCIEHDDEIDTENLFRKVDLNHEALPSVKNRILS